MHGLTIVLITLLHMPYAKGFVPAFNFNTEYNFPTWFSVIILFLSAALFFFIGRHEHEKQAKRRIYWWLLCGAFIFLGLDEVTRMHERLQVYTNNFLVSEGESQAFDGFLTYSWFVPYIVLLAFGGLFLFAFSFRFLNQPV